MDPTPEVLKAMKKEGFLGKQKPGGLYHVYQKRYCKLLNEGRIFAYADKPEHYNQNKIKGQIPLKDVLDIVADEKPKKFQLICTGRVYKFEAPNKEDKYSWVESVRICRDFAIESEEAEKKAMMALDSDIKYEENNDEEEEEIQKKEGGFNLFQPIGFIANTTKKVLVDGTIGTATKLVKTGVTGVAAVFANHKKHTNEEYVKAKNYHQYFDLIDNKLLKSRLVMGYLSREAKEATGMGHLDNVLNDAGIRETVAMRWCMMISSRPLITKEIDPSDNETLDAGKLPFDIEMDVMYCYDTDCDDSKPLETITMNDVLEVVVNKKSSDESFYRFTLDLGDKKTFFISNEYKEMEKWIRAIQSGRSYVKENLKSKLEKVKNMYWILKTREEDDGEEKLKEKIDKDYETLTNVEGTMRADNIEDLLKVQKKVANEFVDIINACLCHKDYRLDIIKLYAEGYHEPIITAMKNYFRKNKEDLQNRDIFEMVNFMIQYRSQLKQFGEGFIDKRMSDGVKVLCRIVARRILKTNLKSIDTIIKREMVKEPDQDARGRAATTAPNDVFKVSNESFNILSNCNTSELTLALLESCQNTLQYYQSGLTWIIRYQDLTMDQLCAMCNNTLTYVNGTKDFVKQAESLAPAMKEEIPKYFDETSVNKGFVDIGKRAYEKIAEKAFESLVERWQIKPFLEIDVEKSLTQIIEKLSDTTSKIHNNYSQKIDVACLESVVTHYIQTFLYSADNNKITKKHGKALTDKLGNDLDILRQVFSKLKKNAVDNALGSITLFHEFFTQGYAFLSSSIKKMKETYGSSLKWKTIELFIKLREDDIPKDEKEEVVQSCKEIYKTTEQISKGNSQFNVFKKVDQVVHGEELNHKQSFISTDGEDDEIQDLTKKMSRQSIAGSFSLNIDGYLDAEKDEFLSGVKGLLLDDLKFERRYFTLRRGVLYCYKDKNSESSLGSHKLENCIGCGPEQKDEFIFFIKLQTKDGEKFLRYRADTIEKKEMWITAINNQRERGEDTMVEVNAEDAEFYKDAYPMFVDIESLPRLEFEMERPKQAGRINARELAKQNAGQTPGSNKSSTAGLKPVRRKSFDINDDPKKFSFSAPQKQSDQKGCMATICEMFGGSKQKKDYLAEQ